VKKYIHPQKKPLSSTSQSFPKANNLILSDAPACCLFLLHANHYYCTLCVSSSQCPLSIDTFIRCSLIIVFCRTSTYTQTITTTLKRAAAVEGENAARGAGMVPAYATYCKNAVAYSSACVCIGIAAATVTSMPTVTAYAPDITVSVCPKAGETNCGGTCYDLGTCTTSCGFCGNAVVSPCSDACDISANTEHPVFSRRNLESWYR
jgi:hypothetical protein